MQIITLCLLAVLAPPISQQKIIIKDSAGRISQSLTIKGSQVTIRNSRGQITGSATFKGNQATVRDNRGRLAAPKR
jgi:hypothetical protein